MMKFSVKNRKSAPVTFSFDLSSFTGVLYMIKDVGKALVTFLAVTVFARCHFEGFHKKKGEHRPGDCS